MLKLAASSSHAPAWVTAVLSTGEIAKPSGNGQWWILLISGSGFPPDQIYGLIGTPISTPKCLWNITLRILNNPRLSQVSRASLRANVSKRRWPPRPKAQRKPKRTHILKSKNTGFDEKTNFQAETNASNASETEHAKPSCFGAKMVWAHWHPTAPEHCRVSLGRISKVPTGKGCKGQQKDDASISHHRTLWILALQQAHLNLTNPWSR